MSFPVSPNVLFPVATSSLLMASFCACCDLQYDEISLTFTAGSVSLCCGRLWSVCEIVVVLYVDAVDDVTVMCVLLFVLHVCLLREYDGAMLTAMLVGGGGWMRYGA